MRKGAPRIGVELLLVGLVLGLLGGSLGLIITVYRARTVERPSPVVAAVEEEPEPVQPAPLPAPPPPPVDLTPGRLREIEAKLTEQKAVTDSIDRRASAMEKAAVSALAEADRYRNREQLIRREVAAREADASRAEAEADALARERDILAQQRDGQRSRLDRARLHARDGVAVLPYKGPNGTWRRPIAIECRGSTATLQPYGPSFTLGELSGFGNPRMNPLVLAVAKTMLRARDMATPDGAASVPYLVFVVRPDGVRPYYAARSLLEPLGIAYGYELADADWDIEYPDLNDPSEWSETPGPRSSPTWPPPPSASELADGDGAGHSDRNPGRVAGGGSGSTVGLDPGASARGPYTGPGTFRPGMASRSRSGGVAGLEGDRAQPSTGPSGGGLPSSIAGGGRVLATPGDGRGNGDSPSLPREGQSPWTRLGNPRGPGGQGGLDVADLESLSRGVGPGGRDVPSDGRVPFYPGQHSEDVPRFEPTPPPGIEDPPSNAREMARPGGSGTTPNSASGVATGSPALVNGGSSSGNSSSAPPRTMREAIARGHGLEAPKGLSGTPSASMPSAPESLRGLASGSPAPTGGIPGTGSSSGDPSGTGAGGYDTGNGIISKTLEMTVACGPKGVTIHPGGEVLAIAALKADDGLLPARLSAIVKARRTAEPSVGLRPRVRFLVKPGGESTYLKARWQTSVAGTGWPLTLQVADRSSSRLFGGGKP